MTYERLFTVLLDLYLKDGVKIDRLCKALPPRKRKVIFTVGMYDVSIASNTVLSAGQS